MKEIVVILSTYNGMEYLRDQLDSILYQTDVKIKIWVRDDGSTDETINILDEYSRESLEYYIGDNIGAKHSFIDAIQTAPDADYYALADQDDVWDKSKLAEAVKVLEKYDKTVPLLYSSESTLVDENLKTLNDNTIRIDKINGYAGKEYEFLEGQLYPAQGSTMVFNRALKDLIDIYTPVTFPMHDYWILTICKAVNGIIIRDSNSYMLYRQHRSNTVGGHKGLFDSLSRRGRFYNSMGKNFHTRMYSEIEEAYSDYIDGFVKNRISCVCSYRNSMSTWIKLIFDRKLYRGSLRYSLETFILVLLRLY